MGFFKGEFFIVQFRKIEAGEGGALPITYLKKDKQKRKRKRS